MSESLNKLRGTSAYLAGPVDHAENPNGWRSVITKDLLDPLGIKAYNPLVKPSWLSKRAKLDPKIYMDDMKALVTEGYLSHDVWNGMREIRDFCKRQVNAADFVIVHHPKKFTTGTFEEIKIAVDALKPILFHLPDGLASTWLPVQYTIDPADFAKNAFQTWEELYAYLARVDSGDEKVNNFRWIFANYHSDPDVKEQHEATINEQVRA
tara:strand:+ start:131707 stop:132333 length:627 start_codon:yes stop_codon:yes gene_type:complete